MICEVCKEDRPARYIHTATLSENGRVWHIKADPECIRKEIGKVHAVDNY